MTKGERNAKIIEMRKNGKTNAEIIRAIKAIDKDMPVSDETIRKVRRDAGFEYNQKFYGPTAFLDVDIEKSNSTKIGQNGFYITEEMWEEMKYKIDSLLDTIDIQTAKIDKLDSNIIIYKELI